LYSVPEGIPHVRFKEENGKVIMISLSGNTLSPGEGLIAEILFNGSGLARLPEIVIAE
jgi:hypothetical protein